MRFNIEEDGNGTSIPGNSPTSLPHNVKKGDKMRPPVNPTYPHTGAGSGSGVSGMGPSGRAEKPVGSHIKGFIGKPPADKRESGNKSPRDKSNPAKVSTSPVMPGMSKTSY